MLMFWAKVSFAGILIQEMDVHIGIFDAAKILLEYRQENSHFSVNTKVDTVNVFGTLYSFSGMYESSGLILKDRIVPELYKTRSQSRHHIRTKKILYDKKGIAYKRISSKDGEVSEKPIVGISKTADAADLQSVFAELIQKFMTSGKCNLVREVDDGKKHYKLISKDSGIEKRYFEFLQKEETAHLCLIYIKNLKDNNDNILWEVSADRPIKLWVKGDEKTKMPIVLEIRIDSTPLGELKVIPNTLKIK